MNKAHTSKAVNEKKKSLVAKISSVIKEYGLTDEEARTKTIQYVDDLLKVVPKDSIKDLPAKPLMFERSTQTSNAHPKAEDIRSFLDS